MLHDICRYDPSELFSRCSRCNAANFTYFTPDDTERPAEVPERIYQAGINAEGRMCCEGSDRY